MTLTSALPAATFSPWVLIVTAFVGVNQLLFVSQGDGLILGVAVLLDAALVRLLLIPVILRLLGNKAWWLPKPLARGLPDVRFGPA